MGNVKFISFHIFVLHVCNNDVANNITDVLQNFQLTIEHRQHRAIQFCIEGT